VRAASPGEGGPDPRGSDACHRGHRPPLQQPRIKCTPAGEGIEPAGRCRPQQVARKIPGGYSSSAESKACEASSSKLWNWYDEAATLPCSPRASISTTNSTRLTRPCVNCFWPRPDGAVSNERRNTDLTGFSRRGCDKARGGFHRFFPSRHCVVPRLPRSGIGG